MKKANLFLFHIPCSIFLILLASCSVNKAHIDNDLKTFYDAQKTEGCFTMLDNATGQITVYNMGMDTMRYAPGATFDIVNNLIALHTGTITDTGYLHSVRDGSDSSSATRISMTRAFQENNSGFTRFVAAGSGKERTKKWIDSLSYGNKIVGDSASDYWGNNTLAISPDEQLGLMKRLYFDQLPFMKSVQESVRSMMVKEDNTLYKWSYKNAVIADEKGNAMNWTIGWVEENRHVYFFVNLIKKQGKDDDIEKTGLDISKQILSHYGFFKGIK